MKTPKLKPATVKSNTNKKKAKFNLSHDVNTTYDWGSVQPLFSKLMLPDSSINVNMEQLTRLAPMVCPTFGRVKLKNIAHFIPMKEIFPNWEYFLSQKPISRPTATDTNTFVPSEIPHINNSILTAFALAGAKANVFISGAVGGGFSNNEDTWRCFRNTGSWGTIAPSAADPWVKFVREFGNKMFGITNSQIGAVTNISEIQYNGWTWNMRKLTKGSLSDGTAVASGLSTGLLNLPTITTMVANPIDQNSKANSFSHSFSNEANSYGPSYYPDDHITMEGADLIWESETITSTARASGSGSIFEGINSSAADGCRVRIVFKLSSFGKRLRKVLIGLGYNFSLSDDAEVSILPLIAYFKAYWDTFAPERTKNFYMTSAWKLIQMCEESNTNCSLTGFLNTSGNSNARRVFREFMMNELGNCFATESIDAISAATDRINQFVNNGPVVPLTNVINDVLADWRANAGGNEFETQQDITSNVGTTFRLAPNSTLDSLSMPELEACKKAYIYINKMSVAGQQLAEILRMNGQGAYVEECNGKFIASNEDSIKISDVVSTADTQNTYVNVKGAALGQYGGRGLGMGTDQFSYNTDKHGYMIILSTIIPESGYINGPDMTNECYTFGSIYNPEFDGLNYEAVVKKQIVGSTLINTQGDNSENTTFGYLPTYSNWKFTNNKANGDFSLNSMKNSLTPYTLDKYIPINDVNIVMDQPDAGFAGTNVVITTPKFGYTDLPNAGEDYRYINKMPWNGNYNRIFNAQDDGIEWTTVNTTNNNAYLYNSFEYDNFLTHNVFSVAYWAPMKAIEDSYSTYDECENESTGGISVA